MLLCNFLTQISIRLARLFVQVMFVMSLIRLINWELLCGLLHNTYETQKKVNLKTFFWFKLWSFCYMTVTSTTRRKWTLLFSFLVYFTQSEGVWDLYSSLSTQHNKLWRWDCCQPDKSFREGTVLRQLQCHRWSVIQYFMLLCKHKGP